MEVDIVRLRQLQEADESAVLRLTEYGINGKTLVAVLKDKYWKLYAVVSVVFGAAATRKVTEFSVITSGAISFGVCAVILSLLIIELYLEDTRAEVDYRTGVWEYWSRVRRTGHGDFFVAESNGDIVGGIGVIQINQGEYEIKRLKVTDYFCRRGIGEKLLREVVDFCSKRRASNVRIQVPYVQEGAMKFCERFGFKPAQVIKKRLLFLEIRYQIYALNL